MSRFVMCLLLILMCSLPALANVTLLPVRIEVRDRAALQRGAKFFMNYCSGCHSLKYLRYNRMAKDLGLTTDDGKVDKELLVSNLIFTRASMRDPIEISMPAVDARQWFGRVPPDLSLTARERGPAWLYTYLKSFYKDTKRPFGTNNLLMPDVAMPNVLAPLIGEVMAVEKTSRSVSSPQSPLDLVLVTPGEMSAPRFDSALQDLVTFLVYTAEPVKLVRFRIGVFVLLFLGLWLLVAYLLKKLYWQKLP